MSEQSSGGSKRVWVVATASGNYFEPYINEVWNDEERARERKQELERQAEPEDTITCTSHKVRSVDTETDQ